MRDSSHLTKGYSDVREHQSDASGYGFFRKHRTVRYGAKFHALTNKHGAVLPTSTPSCKYFERRSQ